MISEKKLKKLKNIVENNDKIKEKISELEELQEKRKSKKSPEKLKREIEELKREAVAQDNMEDAKEIIRQIQDKKTELEIVENNPRPEKEKIQNLKTEINYLIYEEAEEIIKPVAQELWDMYEKALKLEEEIKEVGKVAARSYIGNNKPVGHQSLFDKTISPFDVTAKGNVTELTRIKERRKIAKRKGII